MFKSDVLKKLRENRKWTQTDLMFELSGHGLRIARGTIANWELGHSEPRVSQAYKLSKIFGVSMEKFLSK